MSTTHERGPVSPPACPIVGVLFDPVTRFERAVDSLKARIRNPALRETLPVGMQVSGPGGMYRWDGSEWVAVVERFPASQVVGA